MSWPLSWPTVTVGIAVPFRLTVPIDAVLRATCGYPTGIGRASGVHRVRPAHALLGRRNPGCCRTDVGNHRGRETARCSPTSASGWPEVRLGLALPLGWCEADSMGEWFVRCWWWTTTSPS